MNAVIDYMAIVNLIINSGTRAWPSKSASAATFRQDAVPRRSDSAVKTLGCVCF